MNMLFSLMLLAVLFPGVALAKVDYTRLTPDPLVSSITSIDVSFVDYDREINCGGLGFWGIQAIEHETGRVFSGLPRFVPSTVLDVTFTLDMPPGDYEEITFACSDDGENLAFQHGSLEDDLGGDQIIFASSEAASIVSDPGIEETVTVSIDGDLIHETGTSTEITQASSEEPDTAESPTVVVTEVLPSPAAVFIAVEAVREEESDLGDLNATSSVTGDTTINGTTTSTF